MLIQQFLSPARAAASIRREAVKASATCGKNVRMTRFAREAPTAVTSARCVQDCSSRHLPFLSFLLFFSRRVPQRPAAVLATVAAPSATFFCFRVASCPFATLLFLQRHLCAAHFASTAVVELQRAISSFRSRMHLLETNVRRCLGFSALPRPLSVDLLHSTGLSSFENRRCVPIQAHNGLLSFHRRQRVVPSCEWI